MGAVSVQEIIENFTGGWTGLAEGGGTAVNKGLTSLFVDATGALTTGGIIILLFAGLSIGLGLLRVIMRKFA